MHFDIHFTPLFLIEFITSGCPEFIEAIVFPESLISV
jgi:hypothetical protein